MKAHLFTLAAVLAAAPAAHADNALRPQQIPNKARELAEKGRRHHEAGDYAAAIAAFKEAYVLAPSPTLLFNIAQSYRLSGDCDEAAWMYRRFLDTNPNGKQRELAQQHLSVVEKCGTGGLRISVVPPASVDAKLPETTAKRTGQDLARAATGTDRRKRATEADTHEARSAKYKRIGLYTAIGGGAALAGAALFGLDAADAANQVEDTYAHGGKWKDVQDIDARGHRSATIATVLGVGGGAAVITGAILYGLGHHYEQAHYVAVTPTKDGAQVSLSWDF